MVKTFKEYKADADKQNAELKKNDLGSIDNSADATIKLAEDTYKKLEANTIADYASDYERNAVQKLINEKQVAEKMSDLGLTDSGLNRTQQTAVQMSYANQKGKLDLARQQALDKLSSDLASYVTGINNQREADKLKVNQFYDQQSNTIATEMYNTDVNAGVELQKAAIEVATNNKPLLYDWKGETVLDGNGNSLLKFTGNDGENYNVTPGKNPYTNAYNAKISDIVDGKCIIDKEWQEKNKNSDNEITRACAKYGVFGNGYQPKGICVFVDGEWKDSKLHALTDDKGKIVKASDTGKEQTIWKDDSDKLYIWRGDLNRYKEVVI